MRRKKPDLAVLKTVGMFNGGLAPIEEAERIAREQDGLGDHTTEPRMPGDMIPTAEKAAVVWLLEDRVDRGDEIRIAKGRKGGVVLLLIRGDLPMHPYSTANLYLSKRQWEQLKRLALKDEEKRVDVPFPDP